MLVVSRKPGESVVLEGEEGDITITVSHVGPRRVTFKLDVETGEAEFTGSEGIATRSEVVSLGKIGSMTIVDVRGGMVRLGFELAKGVEVHRKEIFEASRAPRATAAAVSTAKSVVAGVDQTVVIGAAVTITPTDLDATGARVLVRGELLGGPDDGLRIDEAREMRVGGSLQLGTQLTITLATVAGPRARFLVNAPPHMVVTVRV